MQGVISKYQLSEKSLVIVGMMGAALDRNTIITTADITKHLYRNLVPRVSMVPEKYRDEMMVNGAIETFPYEVYQRGRLGGLAQLVARRL